MVAGLMLIHQDCFTLGILAVSCSFSAEIQPPRVRNKAGAVVCSVTGCPTWPSSWENNWPGRCRWELLPGFGYRLCQLHSSNLLLWC